MKGQKQKPGGSSILPLNKGYVLHGSKSVACAAGEGTEGRLWPVQDSPLGLQRVASNRWLSSLEDMKCYSASVLNVSRCLKNDNALEKSKLQ